MTSMAERGQNNPPTRRKAMVNELRSEGSKKSWLTRKRKGAKGTCPFCIEKVWVKGEKHTGDMWHHNCWIRYQTVKVKTRGATSQPLSAKAGSG